MIHVPRPAKIIERLQETKTIFTLKLSFTDETLHDIFSFQPGQFNMLTVPGVGEIPISIVSDPRDSHFLQHTVRVVGRVTQALSALQPGDHVGIRGPFGCGWPIAESIQKDIVFVTGGLGCAPVVAAIKYVLKRREHFNQVAIVQGVKHADDLLWRQQYENWQSQAEVQVELASDVASPNWNWHVGPPTELLDNITFAPKHCSVMLCGPQPMMLATGQQLIGMGVSEHDIWLSMERNMQCGNGQCGHCQIGPLFSCKDGPVFNYSDAKMYLGKRGL